MTAVYAVVAAITIDAAIAALILTGREGALMRETKIGGHLYPLRAIALAVALGTAAALAVVTVLL
jgi:hypothetical protein